MHTTNAANQFITVAPDCPAEVASAPPERGTPTAARIAFELVQGAPYRYTSDDVVFAMWALRKGVDPDDARARAAFFSKGQPCMRACPLTQRYGWGVHADGEGRIALVPMESEAYARLAGGVGPEGEALTVKAAMRSRR